MQGRLTQKATSEEHVAAPILPVLAKVVAFGERPLYNSSGYEFHTQNPAGVNQVLETDFQVVALNS